jgi:diacylglycerol kinase family enzyme
MSMDDRPRAPLRPEHAAVPIVVNRAAGLAGRRRRRRLAAALHAAGLDHSLHEVPGWEIRHAVERIAAAGARVIGVCGGDGSMLAAANVLAGTGIALAPFPGGTLNHFALRHGIPDMETAAQSLVAGHTVVVPTGVADGHVFLNTVTVGYYAEVVRRRERLRRFLTKWPAAAVAFVPLGVRLPKVRVILEAEGRHLVRHTPLVWVGIGWGSFPRGHESRERRAEPDLEVAIVRAPTRRALVAFLFRFARLLLLSERPVDDPALELIHARSVILHAERPALGCTADGELLRCESPLFLGLHDAALLVVKPARVQHPGRPATPARPHGARRE